MFAIPALVLMICCLTDSHWRLPWGGIGARGGIAPSCRNTACLLARRLTELAEVATGPVLYMLRSVAVRARQALLRCGQAGRPRVG